MRNVNICLIVLASILFLLINLYGLLEILRYFKLKQLRELKERIKEDQLHHLENEDWQSTYTSTSQYEKNAYDSTRKDVISSIQLITSPTTTTETTVASPETTSSLPPVTTTRIRVTTNREHISSLLNTLSTPSTIRITTAKDDQTPQTSTQRILITTKPDWFEDSRQLEERRRQNAENRRQQLLRQHMEERRKKEQEEERKRLQEELEERLRQEQEEREKIRRLGEERRRKEHAERIEARRLQELEEQRRLLLKEQERQRHELIRQRQSEEDKRRILEEQKREKERLRAHEEKELIKKHRLEEEQRDLAERQHRERERLREELREIQRLKHEQEEQRIREEEEDELADREGKIVHMSLEDDEEDEEVTTLRQNVKAHVRPSEPYHVEGDWSVGRHRHTTTTEAPTEDGESTQSPKNNDITIVTALIDIGRGDWFHYQRPLEKYHEFMENLLTMRNNMVIFTDHSSYDFIHKYRKNIGLMNMTKIHLVQIDDLPLSRHLPYAQKIIEDEMHNDELYQHDPDMRNHPEAKSAEYNIVVNSKPYFMYNTTLEDPFGTDFYVWIDAGYGHGNQNVFPFNNVWKPTFPRTKVSMIKLTPEYDPIKNYTISNLYRRNWSVVSGGFIAGDKDSIGQLYTITHNKFIHLIYQNKVDDDQTVMVLAINSYPHLFNIKQGDWFDAFRLFSDPDTPFA